MNDLKKVPVPQDPKQPSPKPFSDKGLPPVDHTPNPPPVQAPKKE